MSARVSTPYHAHLKTVIQRGQRGFEMLQAGTVPKAQDAIDLRHVTAFEARPSGCS